jgi:stalled ribosome rescue protein Dom34
MRGADLGRMTHAAVWLDHREARIYPLASSDAAKQTIVTSKHPSRHHQGAHATDKSHPDDEKTFFHEIAHALEGYVHILLVGPSSAKTDFQRYAEDHDKGLATRIDGVETVDHPTDRQVAALGRKFFKFTDDMTT